MPKRFESDQNAIGAQSSANKNKPWPTTRKQSSSIPKMHRTTPPELIFTQPGVITKDFWPIERGHPLESENVAGLTRRSNVYDAKGDLDKAIADMTEVIRLNPESGVAHDRRADMYSRKNETDKAIADMTEVIRLNPDSREAYDAGQTA